MSKKRRSSRARFALGTLLYVLILLLAMSGAVFLLHNYLVIYEDTRPATAMRAYMDGLRGEGFESFKEQAFAGLDRKLSSEEEKDAFLRGLLDDMSWVEDLAGSSETGKLCRIRAGGKTIGTLRLVPEEEQRMGLHGWKPAGFAVDDAMAHRIAEAQLALHEIHDGTGTDSKFVFQLPGGDAQLAEEHVIGSDVQSDEIRAFDILSDQFSDVAAILSLDCLIQFPVIQPVVGEPVSFVFIGCIHLMPDLQGAHGGEGPGPEAGAIGGSVIIV